MTAVKFKEYSLWCIYALAVGWGFIPGPQPVSRNEVPYAVAKKEKNMMTKHSLYVFIILLSIYFVTLHIML